MNDAGIIDRRGESPFAGATGGHGDESVLHHVGSPATAPDGADVNTDGTHGATALEAPAGLDDPGSQSDCNETGATQGLHRQALILAAPWHQDAQPLAATVSASRMRPPMIAVVAIAAALAGSAVTAGVSHWTGSRTAAPPVSAAPAPVALTDAIDRVDRELAMLTTKVDGIAKATVPPAAKPHGPERAEKVPVEPGAKPAKASDPIERSERRPTAPAADGPNNDSRSAIAAAPMAGFDARRPAPATIVEGWTVRDVYNGSALLLNRGGGMLQVYPGDYIPGLGRIEQVRRQDGRWVVVTSRGLIAAR